MVRFSHARYIMPTTAGVRGRVRVGGRVRVWVRVGGRVRVRVGVRVRV